MVAAAPFLHRATMLSGTTDAPTHSGQPVVSVLVASRPEGFSEASFFTFSAYISDLLIFAETPTRFAPKKQVPSGLVLTHARQPRSAATSRHYGRRR